MKPNVSSRTAYERFLNDNPPLDSGLYRAYVIKGGTCWGHFFREHHPKEFKKQYETMWLRNPQLWETEDER